MPPLDQLSPSCRNLRKGEVIFHQGDTASAIFWIEKGCAQLQRRTFDGRLVLIHTALAGEFVAEAALFSETYHCDAVAVEASVIWAYDRSSVRQRIQSDSSTATAFLATVARQLQKTRQRLELRNVRSAKERLALCLQLQADEGGRVTVRGELQGIAAELGLTREALYRSLAELVKSKHITRSEGAILIRKSLGV